MPLLREREREKVRHLPHPVELYCLTTFQSHQDQFASVQKKATQKHKNEIHISPMERNFIHNKATFSVNIESTSASAFATDALACCNSSFKGTAESGSTMLPRPEPLQTAYYLSGNKYNI